ncbi:hypothetical protein MACJ_000725 [Theileria orientalis]|uniref:Cyclin N-terminal domain-containing protein n=1 Tax=Theileria orientalis TaxID=68886 RepID=A0A976M4I9_THEOR|nr:hypothetical protein MACJ_000725 [Theileria orientalis]
MPPSKRKSDSSKVKSEQESRPKRKRKRLEPEPGPENEGVVKEEEKVEVDGEIAKKVNDESVTESFKASLRERIKSSIMSTLNLVCDTPYYKIGWEFYEERSTIRAADTIYIFCHKLSLSLPTLLTALVYLQLYKNASRKWRSTKHYAIASKGQRRRKFLKWDDQYLSAAACVLLAWKYKEDEIGLVRSTKKLYDLSVTLYKIIVFQSSKKTDNLSVSSWMLQDSGEEIKTLRSQILDRENQILHALDYFIGPIPLPDSFISPYCKLFLLSMTDDLVDNQEYCRKLEQVATFLVVDFYKTQLCVDYTPNEIVAIAIIKSSCLLSFVDEKYDVCKYNFNNENLFKNARDLENRLSKFISSLSDSGLQ